MKTLFLFLFTLSLSAQIHKPEIHGDPIAKKATDKFVFYMESNPINYEKDYRRVKEIKSIQADRYFVGEFKNGIIYLNSRLDQFPGTKEAVILNYLAINTGAKMDTSFNITEDTEKRMKRQTETNYIYELIVKRLISANPLRSKQ